jgi:hypothetical protein
MTIFTIVHVVFSLVGIISGFVVAAGLLSSKRLDGWTLLFLATTLATSLTGFGFPVERLLPSHVVGTISVVVLAAATFARYVRLMAGSGDLRRHRGGALYFNVFVLVAAVREVPALNALTTQSELPGNRAADCPRVRRA